MADLGLHSGSSDEDDSDYVPEEKEDDIEDDEISNPESDEEKDGEKTPSPPPLSASEEKKKTEEIWKKFLSTEVTAPPEKAGTDPETVTTPEVQSTPTNDSTTSVVKDTSKHTDIVAKPEEQEKKPVPCSSKPVPKKRGGLDSLLSGIGNKKSKMTILQKSQMDWDSFKKEEGIGEDLQTINKGKMGYLERQAFLMRSDYRSFEVEKNVRLSKK